MSVTPNEAIGAFERFVRLFRKSPINTILSIIILLLVGTYGVTVYAFYKDAGRFFTHLMPTPEQETLFMQKSTEVANKINPLIEKANVDLNSSKVLIALYHNGKTGLSAVPWNFYSVRYAAIAQHVDYDINESQNIPNTIMAELYAAMWPQDGTHPLCIVRRPSDLTGTMLKARIENRNNKAFYICPIQTSKGVPIGWISVNYNFNNVPKRNDQFNLNYLKELTEALQPLLEDDLKDL